MMPNQTLHDGISWLLCALLVSILLGTTPGRADEVATYVGEAACAGCHAGEAARWKGSHHDQAMQQATKATVVGDFNAATLDHFGTVTSFFRSADKFLVRTDGPDGSLHDYEIAYTFGVYPLQQYLIAMPGGRLQAFGIAWDTRPKDQGGQRWFHLYPDRQLPPGDRLHWTGRDQIWNHMCADCHSTNVKKNYDLATNTYATTWSEINVACEACHGPGSQHLAWAQSHKVAASATDRIGLVTWLKPTDKGLWELGGERGIARRTEPLISQELETCATCHSRRRPIATAPEPGGKLLDSYGPAYLEPGLYHADGQIDGEVFEYGSFVQSRMSHAGVTCSNCHEPHDLKLRAHGNAVCAQCHAPAKFDVAEHHHHAVGSIGAQCVNCHMPTKTYMVVDDRRDHSLRVPRPDLTLSIGTPNACSGCHRERSSEWAARAVADWFPNGRQTTPHYGTALQAGRTDAADAERKLDALILDGNQPAIARASAVLLLQRNASPASEEAIKAAIADRSALVRAAVPRALPPSPERTLVQAVAPLLDDPVREVRIETARVLAGADQSVLTPEQMTAFDRAYRDLVAAVMMEADRPEAHLNLGLLDLRRRQPAAADAEYRTALRLDPAFVPAMVNLADLDRLRGQEQDGADLLRKALALEPDNADVRHSLGLLLVRQRAYPEALLQLQKANELAPDNSRYAYVYAIALNSSGVAAQAYALLERTHRQHPSDRDVLVALVSIARDNGDVAAALIHARELAVLYPSDAQIRAAVRALERQQAK